MKKFLDLSGKRFSRLTVVRPILHKRNRIAFECRCDCGKDTITWSACLRSGDTKSCGCLSKESSSRRFRKHNKSGARLYRVWAAMKKRCKNEKDPCFSRYGGRGITVSKKWENFDEFLKDMGEPKKGMTLERINNNLGYSKENCRWATRKEQARNTSTNVIICHNGETKTLTAWAQDSGILVGTLCFRIKSGWPMELALTMKPSPSNRPNRNI